MPSGGPLSGVRVVELAGLAPAPYCGMLLADFGASVVRVDRLGDAPPLSDDQLTRGKRSIAVDLKKKTGLAVVRRLCQASDVLIDPFRPGVLEKLGLGPRELLGDNPRLVVSRITGYGQTGPWAPRAGHDINYLALSGLLSKMRPPSAAVSGDSNIRTDGDAAGPRAASPRPYAPLNLVADFAGGGLLAAFGVLAALLQRHTTGRGQVVDASMAEGAAYVGSFVQMTKAVFSRPTGENLLDGGNPLYDTYETKDGRFMAVGALEPKFHRILFEKLGMDTDISLIDTFQRPEAIRTEMRQKFLTKTQDEWSRIFDGMDACTVAVLETEEELLTHAQLQSRGAFVRTAAASTHTDGVEPTPAPRLSDAPYEATPRRLRRIATAGEHSREILTEFGFSAAEIQRLNEEGAIDTTSSDRKAKL